MSIARFKLRSADPAALLRFYAEAFGALPLADGFGLGEERVEIAPAADPRPDAFLANETGFQHFAIVVADMAQAYARLCDVAGWRLISLAGPVRLPEASGGATAFKFRDPEEHPLELIEFAADAVPAFWRARFDAEPSRVFHGIDHSAITVRDIEASARFWGSAGFGVGRRRWNRGGEQALLDGFADSAEVEIVSVTPLSGGRPGIELLGYRTPHTVIRASADNSVAATAVVLSGVAPSGRDPDGHRIESDQP
jgi:catechol 2,3-dioxygenase-like lactoylglutathione lyase family enzyme